MINPENHLGIVAVLIALSALSFTLERTRLGSLITGTVIMILLSIFAANVGVIPHQATAYDWVFAYLVPVLIPLFLLQGDVRRVVREAARTGLAFLIATVGTVIGVLVAVSLLDLSALAPEAVIDPTRKEAAIAGLFAATYIGGSVNYAALGEITGLVSDPSFFAAATAADNLFSAVFLSLIGLIAGNRWLNARYPQSLSAETTADTQNLPAITLRSILLALAVSALLVVISDWLGQQLAFAGARFVILTLLTLAIATLLPKIRIWTAGSFEIGVRLSFIFFGSIAAGANIKAMLVVAPLLIGLVVILLAIHLTVLLAVGRWMKLSLPELLTASNAAILGATTAPAMAAAKGWHDQVTPGVLVGVMGYGLGTLIGTALFNLM